MQTLMKSPPLSWLKVPIFRKSAQTISCIAIISCFHQWSLLCSRSDLLSLRVTPSYLLSYPFFRNPLFLLFSLKHPFLGIDWSCPAWASLWNSRCLIASIATHAYFPDYYTVLFIITTGYCPINSWFPKWCCFQPHSFFILDLFILTLITIINPILPISLFYFFLVFVVTLFSSPSSL